MNSEKWKEGSLLLCAGGFFFFDMTEVYNKPLKMFTICFCYVRGSSAVAVLYASSAIRFNHTNFMNILYARGGCSRILYICGLITYIQYIDAIDVCPVCLFYGLFFGTLRGGFARYCTRVEMNMNIYFVFMPMDGNLYVLQNIFTHNKMCQAFFCVVLRARAVKMCDN